MRTFATYNHTKLICTMKLSTTAKVFAIALLGLLFTSCKGSGLLPEEDADGSGKPVKMVHTYVITAEEPVNLIWNVMAFSEDEVFLNGESIGNGLSPVGQLSPEDQTTIKGTQTFSFESTTSSLWSSFQIDWDHSKGKSLSYKFTITKRGKQVFSDELSLPNKKQTHTTGIGWSNRYQSTTVFKNSDGFNK